jgi:hypothetical protein
MPVAPEEFAGTIRPDRPVCFVIHGSYNRWGDVVSESRNINRWIRAGAPQAPLQVVFFTWPSDGNMPFILPIDIAVLGRRSAVHAIYLAQLISQFPPGQRISIIGHSHGARTALAALHALGGGCIEGGNQLMTGPPVPHRIRTVLAAAAVDHHWLNPGERYGKSLCPVERLLILKNPRDFTLSLYPLRRPLSHRSLGRQGLGLNDRMALDGLNSKVVELDVSCFAGWGHAWADYYTEPDIARGIACDLYFLDDVLGTPPAALPTPIQPRFLPPVVTPALPAAAAPGTRSGPALLPFSGQPRQKH